LRDQNSEPRLANLPPWLGSDEKGRGGRFNPTFRIPHFYFLSNKALL